MNPHLARYLTFFSAMALGLLGFFTLATPWNFIALGVAFVLGGSASMAVFRRLANEDQIKADLEARLHND